MSCTTARLSPTATFTSATRSTRFSKTSSSNTKRSAALARPTSRVGIATGCRLSSRSRRKCARPAIPAPMRLQSAAPAMPTHESTLISSARSSSASASWAIGKILTSRSTRNTKPTNYACSRTSSSRDLSIAAKNRFTGASPVARRSPKPRWNTRITSARAFS